ncbi:MAG: hypothetical protein PHG81_08510 [Aliarcobacter sp.]|nr:hypothetical protein [Aliarcobacter sp.]
MNEHSKNLIISGTAAIPIVGGSISILIDKYIPSELEKRRNNLIEKFDNDIEAIKEEIKPGRLESEEYMTILFKVFKSAIEEHSQEKIKLFRAILKNSAICEYIVDPSIEFYIKLVNDLTITHFRFLKLVFRKEYFEFVHYFESTEFDKSFQDAFINDLLNMNLIAKDVLSPYIITSIGEKFIKFIELQQFEE